MTSTQQRAELHRQIWQIANEVRGSVDGWDFKQYVLGILFYRYISENLTDYINRGEHEAGRDQPITGVLVGVKAKQRLNHAGQPGGRQDQAAHRVVDLKNRGFDKAGLYDPQGVGGTHVMYVLHHADKPSLYKGLPDDPSISPMVSLWKGVAKPLAMAALGAAAIGSLFHYITKGPNDVSKDLEDEMERKDAEALNKENGK